MPSRNVVIRNFDVLVCTVGSARPPVLVLALAVLRLTIKDAISSLQICLPRCWIFCAEPDIITAHWKWVGNWSANRWPSEHIPNWSFKDICVSRADTVGLKVANTDWGMYQLHNYRPFCCLLCWQLNDRDNRTRIAGHNQSMEMSPEEFSTLTRCHELNPVAREPPGYAGLQANQTYK